METPSTFVPWKIHFCDKDICTWYTKLLNDAIHINFSIHRVSVLKKNVNTLLRQKGSKHLIGVATIHRNFATWIFNNAFSAS